MSRIPKSGVRDLDQLVFELEIARLIAAAVNLDLPPEQIDPTAPLFGDGLGLDSIDLLEIALAVSENYGFSLRSDDPDNHRIFSSLRAFSAHIAQHRSK
ncbi:MAG: acyl carrier protein [Betaproteobacteria bacterium]|nr:acyl carrier protein [Betaproteobacteria bacterium]